MDQKLTKARIKVIIGQPFFGHILMKLQFDERDDAWFAQRGVPPTMGTDGESIFYAKSFIADHTVDELYFGLVHEIGHIIFFHHVRRNNRNAVRWNMAGDYVINDHIKGIGSLPKGVLYDEKYSGLLTEVVYEMMPECGRLDFGYVIDSPNPNKEYVEQQTRRLLVEAASFAKSCGKLPAGFEDYIDGVNNPLVPWYRILKRRILAKTNSEFDWMRPSKRYVVNGVYLPSVKRGKKLEVCVFWDTSGSMSKQEMELCANEISSILDDFKAEVDVLYVDCKVHDHKHYSPEDLPIKFKTKGGGGTDFKPPFKWVKNHEMSPKFVVYFTDMECDSFPKDPGYPVYWINTSNSRASAPFGEVISIKGERE